MLPVCILHAGVDLAFVVFCVLDSDDEDDESGIGEQKKHPIKQSKYNN